MVDINAHERAPPYEAKQTAVKILIEVGEYDMAYHVINTLLAEDDEVVVVWYLAGWMYHLKGEGYADKAARHLLHAKQLASKVNFDDVEILQHVDELLGCLKQVEGEKDDEDEEESNQQAENGEIETTSGEMDVQ